MARRSFSVGGCRVYSPARLRGATARQADRGGYNRGASLMDISGRQSKL
jgi:hypothetical protein